MGETLKKGTKEDRSKDRPVYQPWYEGDFWTIRVRRMHPMARLMYRSMLQGAWDLDKVGIIPNEPNLLKALADCPDDQAWEMYGPAVMEMFELSRNGKFYSNSRQMQELATWKEKHESYSKRGKDGANAKKEKRLKTIEDYTLAEAQLEPSLSPSKKDGSNQAKQSQAKQSQVKDNTSCADESAPVVTLILNDKSEYGISAQRATQLCELYPAADVPQELRKMKGWLISNPVKRKTKTGIEKFVNAWMARVQDQGGPSPNLGVNGNGNHGTSNAERKSDLIRETTNRVFGAAIDAVRNNPTGVPDGDK